MRSELCCLFIVYSLAGSIECRRPFVFHFNSTECTGSPKLFSLFECSVREENDASTFSMEIVVAEDIAKLKYDLLVTLRNGNQDVILFDKHNLDGCSFLANSSSFPLIQIIRKLFQKYSTLPNKCPLIKGTSISVRGLKLDPESFPSYVPETRFYVRVRMFEAGVQIFNLTINGTCENTRKFYLGWG